MWDNPRVDSGRGGLNKKSKVFPNPGEARWKEKSFMARDGEILGLFILERNIVRLPRQKG
jgi:hypothetical protein